MHRKTLRISELVDQLIVEDERVHFGDVARVQQVVGYIWVSISRIVVGEIGRKACILHGHFGECRIIVVDDLNHFKIEWGLIWHRVAQIVRPEAKYFHFVKFFIVVRLFFGGEYEHVKAKVSVAIGDLEVDVNVKLGIFCCRLLVK